MYVVLITEPHCFKGQVRLDNAEGEVFYAKSPRPRACIRARQGLQAWQVDKFSDEDMTTIALMTEKKQVMYMASIYLDILLIAEKLKMIELIDECNSKRYHSLWALTPLPTVASGVQRTPTIEARLSKTL